MKRGNVTATKSSSSSGDHGVGGLGTMQIPLAPVSEQAGGDMTDLRNANNNNKTMRGNRRRQKALKRTHSSVRSIVLSFTTIMLSALVLFLSVYFLVVVYFLSQLEGVETSLKLRGHHDIETKKNPFSSDSDHHLDTVLDVRKSVSYSSSRESLVSVMMEERRRGVLSKPILAARVQLLEQQKSVSFRNKLWAFVFGSKDSHKETFYTVQERPMVPEPWAFTINRSAFTPEHWHNSTEIVDMRQLTATLPFANEDGGVWKQGWDVMPRQIDPNASFPFQIFIVPHSHCDPGWLKTFDEYFQHETKNIISSVVTALEQDARRKFIWAEISYFSWWWEEQTPEKHEVVRRLLRAGQLEFVTGGWVQPDEANSNFDALEIQMQEGHDWIATHVGPEFIPRYGWSIDPFGYSPSLPYLLKSQFDFEAILIQRVHYAVKKELASRKHLEFYWRQTWDDAGHYDMLTHLMPFYSYDIPHTCGPDPSVCCQFDFGRAPIGRSGACPWRKNPQVITDGNVKERAMLLLDQYLKKANLYRGNAVLIPLGDDFRYQSLQEATDQYTNYQKMFDYINANVAGVNVQFGTLSQYFETVKSSNFVPPILKGSFFTYADVNNDYWSGYFTSRVFDKALDRQLERVIYAAESLGASRQELQNARRQLSLFQHHDGVTGTAKTPVVKDYANRMFKAIKSTQEKILEMMSNRNTEVEAALALQPRKAITQPNTTDGSKADENSDPTKIQSCWRSDDPRGLSENMCGDGERVFAFNPLLDTAQMCGDIEVKGGQVIGVTLPCEKTGPATDSSPKKAKFDSVTGMMTWPIKEQWNVWIVNKGGAYLFFPDHKVPYVVENSTIEQQGYVVATKVWRRSVIERPTPPNLNVTVFDFVYEINLQEDNREWFVRFTAGVQNNRTFYTDLNGLNFDTHHRRDDLPIQSQVFPMPAHAAIQDNYARLTVLSEHAQGTASLVDGSIDVFLDRRLRQDDFRGLGQGVQDNVATRTRFRVVLEREGFDKTPNAEFQISRYCREEWNKLNHPLEFFGRHTKSHLEHHITVEPPPPIRPQPHPQLRPHVNVHSNAHKQDPGHIFADSQLEKNKHVPLGYAAADSPHLLGEGNATNMSQEEKNIHVPPGYAAAYPHLVGGEDNGPGPIQTKLNGNVEHFAGGIDPASILDTDYLDHMHEAGGSNSDMNYSDRIKDAQVERERRREQQRQGYAVQQ